MSGGLAAVVLAAGAGTRMKSSRSKVIHEVLGRPLVHFPVLLARNVGAQRVVVVTGHAREQVEACVREALPDAHFALQAEQRGTGHAVLCAREACGGTDEVLILSGDVPGLRPEAIRAMQTARVDTGAPFAALVFDAADPTGYGRIVRDADGRMLEIVEHRDCSSEQRAITTSNAGVYLCDRAFLFDALDSVGDDNDQGEYYLTDIARIAADAGTPGACVFVPEEETAGINDRAQLAEAEARVRRERNLELMRSGVAMRDPERTWVGFDVVLGPDVTLEPDVTLRGRTVVRRGSVIGQGSVLEDATLGEECWVKPYCVVTDARLDKGCVIGPFAHLRPGTEMAEGAKVGNFVETKKAKIGAGSKASHLTYLGDCTLGRDVNVGAGTITCNYDGVGKHQTRLGDGVFVGSNTELVAPVRVGEGAVIGAGTTVTRDVPDGALAVSRAPQKNIEDWARRHGPAARRARKEG